MASVPFDGAGAGTDCLDEVHARDAPDLPGRVGASVPTARHQASVLPWGDPIVSRAVLSFSFVLAGAMFFSVGSIAVWHLYLVGTAQTSLEVMINRSAASEARLRGEVRPYIVAGTPGARPADGPAPPHAQRQSDCAGAARSLSTSTTWARVATL